MIAHRANLRGPQPQHENKVSYILQAIESGYHVECDVWMVNGELWCGHDKPQYGIQESWLRNYNYKLWIHCKNRDAFEYLSNPKKALNVFFNDKDDYTITSKGYILANIGIPTKGIAILPEITNMDIRGCKGAITDYPVYYKLATKQIPLSFIIITKGENDILLYEVVKSILRENIPIFEIIIIGETKLKFNSTSLREASPRRGDIPQAEPQGLDKLDKETERQCLRTIVIHRIEKVENENARLKKYDEIKIGYVKSGMYNPKISIEKCLKKKVFGITIKYNSIFGVHNELIFCKNDIDAKIITLTNDEDCYEDIDKYLHLIHRLKNFRKIVKKYIKPAFDFWGFTLKIAP